VDIRSDGKELSFICDETSALALEREATDLKKYEGGYHSMNTVPVTYQNIVMEDESSERTHSWMAIYSHDGGERKSMSSSNSPTSLTKILRHITATTPPR
jgi:hypothetical protein